MQLTEKGALAQSWLDQRYLGLTPRHFRNGVCTYGYDGFRPPEAFQDVWLNYNCVDEPPVPQRLADYDAILIFGDPHDQSHCKGICNVSAALSVCNDSPPVFWLFHTVAPEHRPPGGTWRHSDYFIREAMTHGLDEVIESEKAGMELVVAIRTRIQKSDLLAKTLNAHIEQRRNEARDADNLQSTIHDILWCQLCRRLAPAIPSVDPDLPPGEVWTLPGYNFGKRLGNGSFCTVYRLIPLGFGNDQYDGTCDEVVKVINKSLMCEPEDIRSLGGMIDIMLRLTQPEARHPNLTELRGIYHSPTHIFVRESFGGAQNLFGWLVQRHHRRGLPRPQSLAHTITIITHLCAAVNHIHNNLRLCHRDIKPENILIDDSAESIHLRLTDFDLATIQKANGCCKKVCGTMPFIAPEVLSQTKYDGIAADIWSTGLVLFEVHCGTKVLEQTLAAQKPDSKLGDTKTVSSRKLVADFISMCFSKPNFACNILEQHCLDDIRPLLPVTKPLFQGMCTVSLEQRLTAQQSAPFMARLEEMRQVPN